MAKIENIISYINTQLQNNQFGAARFQKGAFYGLAELVTVINNDNEETFPSTVLDNGKATKIVMDDRFQLYHRLQSYSSVNGFTDTNIDNTTETYSMLLVVTASRKALELTQEDLYTGISVAFPEVVPKATRDSLGLLTATIELGDFNTNKNDVWTQEYSSTPDLKPNSIIFSVNYEVETSTNNSCFTLCE